MKELHAIYPELYGTGYSEKEMDERFEALLSRHCELLGTRDAEILS